METQVTPLKVGIKYGIIFGLIAVVINAITQTLGIDTTTGQNIAASIAVGVVSLVLYVVGMFLANNEFKKFNEGYISFGQGFQTGMFFAILLGVISATYQVVYVTVINPDFVKEQLAKVEETYEAQGMSEEQIEAAIGIIKTTLSPTSMWFFALIGSLCMGLIAALIVSAITKKERVA